MNAYRDSRFGSQSIGVDHCIGMHEVARVLRREPNVNPTLN